MECYGVMGSYRFGVCPSAYWVRPRVAISWHEVEQSGPVFSFIFQIRLDIEVLHGFFQLGKFVEHSRKMQASPKAVLDD